MFTAVYLHPRIADRVCSRTLRSPGCWSNRSLGQTSPCVLPGFQHTVCLELAAAAILISDCLSIFKSILFVQSSIYRTPIRLGVSASKVRPYGAKEMRLLLLQNPQWVWSWGSFKIRKINKSGYDYQSVQSMTGRLSCNKTIPGYPHILNMINSKFFGQA